MKNTGLGKIILLNGASSSGKSTLCDALQKQLAEPFLRFSLDFLMFNSNVLPERRDEEGLFSWRAIRPKLFQGYYNCLSGLAMAGNNVLVDYIFESEEQLHYLVNCLSELDVFLVGVHCPLKELERRENQRGDRNIGEVQEDFKTVHTFTTYDFDIDSTQPPEVNAKTIISAWRMRSYPSVFNLLATKNTT